MHPLLVGEQTCTVTTEGSAAVPQEAGNRSTSRSVIPFLSMYPKDSHPTTVTLTCLSMFTSALFIKPDIGNSRKMDKVIVSWSWWLRSLILALRRQKQRDPGEFKASLVY